MDLETNSSTADLEVVQGSRYTIPDCSVLSNGAENAGVGQVTYCGVLC